VSIRLTVFTIEPTFDCFFFSGDGFGDGLGVALTDGDADGVAVGIAVGVGVGLIVVTRTG
jgi:hypothetical protein